MAVFYQPNAAATTSFPYADPPGVLSTVTLEFDNAGKLIGPANINIDLTSLNGKMIELDISRMTELATDYTPLEANMNGNAPAAIKQVMIGADGNVYAEYANGATTGLYKLPLVTVASPDRLQVLPGYVFSPVWTPATSRSVSLTRVGWERSFPAYWKTPTSISPRN